MKAFPSGSSSISFVCFVSTASWISALHCGSSTHIPLLEVQIGNWTLTQVGGRAGKDASSKCVLETLRCVHLCVVSFPKFRNGYNRTISEAISLADAADIIYSSMINQVEESHVLNRYTLDHHVRNKFQYSLNHWIINTAVISLTNLSFLTKHTH